MFLGHAVLLAGVVFLTRVTTVLAHPSHRGQELHDHSLQGALPSATWYQPLDHPVRELFRRQGNDASSVQVGSPAWVAAYPSSTPDTNTMPQTWKDALTAAVAAGKIPDIPASTLNAAGLAVYPAGVNQDSPEICSATNRVCRNAGDVYNAPEGSWWIGFDDGPLPPSQYLYEFLQQQNQRATHFFIGVNIVANPDLFVMAATTLQHDIAVHTWTHPHMTTLSNEDLVAQFGWTMQIIFDSTGGHIPAFWRPPYGDTDARVYAIATEIFGLTAFIWNEDSSDWTLSDVPPPVTVQQVETSIQGWLAGPKDPGLIILEHELSNDSVTAFMTSYPVGQKNGWNTVSTIQGMLGGTTQWWQNATAFPLGAASVDTASSTSSSSSSGSQSSSAAQTSGSSSSTTTSSSSSSSPASATTPVKVQTNGATRQGFAGTTSGKLTFISLAAFSILLGFW